ncbi:MAG: DNA polymerase III subunit delta' [Thermodesulfobacteria bacterium]|nr:DNA polymerase III subunit delta' [Thermodesulfobacteriota bacterium]
MELKTLNEIKYQKPAINLLKLALEKDRLSHAYLFTGIKGVGKETTARAFILHLFCEKSKENPCKECKSCKKVFKKVHPDILELFPEKREITIKQVREVINFLKYAPVEASYKVVLIRDAEKLNPEAGNALLKSLEEPPSYALFILITENFTQLLPTIVSRTQVVRFRSLPESFIAEELKKKYWLEEEIALTLARVAQGSLGLAIEIAEKGVIEELHAFVKAGVSESELAKFKVVERLASLSKEQIEIFFYILSMWVWISYLARKSVSTYPKAFPEETYKGDPFKAIELIKEVQFAIERYAHQELAFFRLMLNLFSNTQEYTT